MATRRDSVWHCHLKVVLGFRSESKLRQGNNWIHREGIFSIKFARKKFLIMNENDFLSDIDLFSCSTVSTEWVWGFNLWNWIGGRKISLGTTLDTESPPIYMHHFHSTVTALKGFDMISPFCRTQDNVEDVLSICFLCISSCVHQSWVHFWKIIRE